MFKEIARLNEDREEGFTLIELLVVIVIIGILISIAVVSFLNQRKKANDAAVKSDLRNAVLQMQTATMELGGQNLGKISSVQNGQKVTVKAGDTTLIEGGSDANAMKQSTGSLTAMINPVQSLASSSSDPNVGKITLSPGVKLTVESGEISSKEISFLIFATHENGERYNEKNDTGLSYQYYNSFETGESYDNYDEYGYAPPPA